MKTKLIELSMRLDWTYQMMQPPGIMGTLILRSQYPECWEEIINQKTGELHEEMEEIQYEMRKLK